MAGSRNQNNASSMLTGRTIAGGVIIVILLTFILQNRNETQLSLLFWDINTGLWFLLAITVVLAFLAGLLMGRSVGKSSQKK